MEINRGRILVVDDDKAFLLLTSHLLESLNFEVATISDSAVAYNRIIEFAPDLVILDIEMPNLDGEALFAMLKASKLTSHIPVIFLSAVTLPETIRNNLQAGAEDFLNKPIHPNVLRAKVNKVMERVRHERMVKNIVSRYLGPSVAQMIIKEPEKIKVYGVRQPMVALFADVRGFSSIVENMEPEDIVNLLNVVLAILSEAIFSFGGTIDKFLGDGIMAFWGAPLPCENMEALAVESALTMIRQLREFNDERRFPGGLEIRLGIGISSGNAVVGNIGYEKRSDYTIIGEMVNVAARLEKLAKPEKILISSEMYEKIKDKFSCRDVGETAIRGKTLPIHAYEVIGAK